MNEIIYFKKTIIVTESGLDRILKKTDIRFVVFIKEHWEISFTFGGGDNDYFSITFESEEKTKNNFQKLNNWLNED